MKVADTLGDEEVLDELTGLLRKFTGDPGVPRPRRLHRHAWSTDPFSLGSASYPILATDSAGSHTFSTQNRYRISAARDDSLYVVHYTYNPLMRYQRLSC